MKKEIRKKYLDLIKDDKFEEAQKLLQNNSPERKWGYEYKKVHIDDIYPSTDEEYEDAVEHGGSDRSHKDKAIVIEENGRIHDGNHRYRQAELDGDTKINVVLIFGDYRWKDLAEADLVDDQGFENHNKK